MIPDLVKELEPGHRTYAGQFRPQEQHWCERHGTYELNESASPPPSVPPQRVEPDPELLDALKASLGQRYAGMKDAHAHRADLDAAVLRAVEGEPPASQRCCGAIVPAHDPGCYRYRPASQEGPSEGAAVYAKLEQIVGTLNGATWTEHDRSILVALIDSALSSKGVAVRDEALEEAARVAETEPSQWTCTESIEHAVVSSRCIAHGIRALKGGKP